MLEENFSILSDEERQLGQMLLDLGQRHLFDHWAPPGQDDDKKHAFFRQIKKVHESYPIEGGLRAYIERARNLLTQSKEGVNPLEGWTPNVPRGESLDPGSDRYAELERLGADDVGKCGFVLVAGGLGERLGYSGVKIELPSQTITNMSYIELFIQQILTFQNRYQQGSQRKLPLAIMVSDDTIDGTLKLLRENDYFGMDEEQITIMKQEKVPAIMDSDAHIALDKDNQYSILTKPHGHGDVHSLLHSTGTARRWAYQGIEWIVFFQDTNGLAFYTLPAMLGVSKSQDFEVNSLAIPRKAKQAIGAVAKLTNKEGHSITVNVEYNQLDPLLRDSGYEDGDTNDPATGFSPFPGNINQLLFKLQPYIRVLEETRGVMGEFVNPKYADPERTTFKKPTRLESMMQDYPKVLGPDARVGFTTVPTWISFSPVKNNVADAAKAAASGIPPASAATAESDQLLLGARMMETIGCQLQYGSEQQFQGIPATLLPAVVFHPSFVTSMKDVRERFPQPSAVRLSNRAVLDVKGDVVIESLQLDGALRLEAAPGSRLIVRAGQVSNSGYEVIPISADQQAGEVLGMRGYMFRSRSRANAVAHESGSFVYDGQAIVRA